MQHLQPNTTLQGGKYRIERVLGQGGFGITYMGYNTVFNEPVAIKEFFMQGINDRFENTGVVNISIESDKQQFQEQLAKFKKEALRIRKLDNPHIIKVHDLFEENGTAYYIMDYIDGENLTEYLKRTGQPMPEQEVRLILPQILDALKTIHDAGIWHLDLKPANIMIDKTGKIKLIDFGASKQLNTQKGGATTSTAISYTNGYAPREQMEQNYDKFGPWTDIYALGATLFCLLTNKRPPLPTDIDDDTSTDKHIALPFPESISEGMKDYILKLMQTNRNQRPQNVDVLLEDYSFSTDNKETFEKEKTMIQKIEGEKGNSEKANEDESDAKSEQSPNTVSDRENTNRSNKKRFIFVLLGIITFIALSWGFYYYLNREIDYTTYNEALVRKAKDNDAQAQFGLGICYYDGIGVPKDYSKAVEWFEKAAIQGNAEAQDYLGNCYLDGEGVPKDFTKAVYWYSKAAEQGNAEGQKDLGYCYLYGYGLSLDYTKAFDLFTKAAEQNNSVAKSFLGYCYSYGKGVTEDKAKGVEWYTKAADDGLNGALERLVFCYEWGFGVPKDHSKALEYFTKVVDQYKEPAEQGDSEAQFQLGRVYYSTFLSTKDYPKAVEWFEKAASQGNADAQYYLGECYITGQGVPKDYIQATEWYTKAAEQGDDAAAYSLADLYYYGDAIPQDYSKAIKWGTIAADKGNSDAEYLLANCYLEGTGVPQNYSKAIELYKKAADHGNTLALVRIGECYANGIGVEKNIKMAIYWYEKAEMLGDSIFTEIPLKRLRALDH